jgi:hypothetical protein
VTVPVSAIHLLVDILNQMAQGNVNVSRPYLIKQPVGWG